MARKQVSAVTAFARYIELKNKPAKRPVAKINECPDCNGTGKQGRHVCYTCGGESDEENRAKLEAA